jgi:hypothetical protein
VRARLAGIFFGVVGETSVEDKKYVKYIKRECSKKNESVLNKNKECF